MTKAVTIDDYIALAPEAGRSLLERLRALCQDAAPRAAEQIKWGHPAYVHPDGVILFMFSAHKAHASLAFTPSTKTAFADELAAYRTLIDAYAKARPGQAVQLIEASANVAPRPRPVRGWWSPTCRRTGAAPSPTRSGASS